MSKDFKPLDEKTFTVSNKNVPALHPSWKETIDFIAYKAPPINSEDRAGMEEWMELTGFIVDDLDILLRMPHQKFWCHAIFDYSLHQCVDSYLRFVPRSYDVVYSLPKDMKDRHDTLHRMFFMTCLRMATHKESRENYITPQMFGEIIYENYLFDIPKIMDICVLYGSANGPLLSKMISNIFNQQPKYISDLEATIPTMAHVLESIAQKCGGHLSSGSAGSPVKINPGQKNKNPLISMAVSEFQDVVFYLADTANTICSFLETYPSAAKIFMDCQDFAIKFVTFYETIVPIITEALKERNWEGSTLNVLLTKKLHQAQVCLIKIFRQMIFQGCLHRLLESTSEDEIAHLTEEYLTIMSAILGERRFLAHLDYLYPFREDRDMISQSPYAIDDTRLQFVQDAICEARSIHVIMKHNSNTTFKKDAAKNVTKKSESVQPVQKAVPEINPEEIGACARKITGIELQSIISSVQDLLPDLGEGFIELCLEEFDYNVEKVINCVLEDKLPPSLQEIDKTMARDISKLADEVEEMESMLDKRLNVYDNDEFDAFRNQIDSSKVFMGKKEKAPKSMKQLDAEKDLSSVKLLYDKYGSEQVESMYDVPQDYDYDDEYDDTYDSNLVGADDADSADELTARRPFIAPRVLGRGHNRYENDDSENDSENENNPYRKPRDQFIEDPAEVRRRQEQRRATMQQQRGGKRGQHHNAPQQPKKQYDVTGNPKGQGQDKDTVRNRTWKEKNKATRVHHNRKNLSDKKRAF